MKKEITMLEISCLNENCRHLQRYYEGDHNITRCPKCDSTNLFIVLDNRQQKTSQETLRDIFDDELFKF